MRVLKGVLQRAVVIDGLLDALQLIMFGSRLPLLRV